MNAIAVNVTAASPISLVDIPPTDVLSNFLSGPLASISSNGFLGVGLFAFILALGLVLHKLNMMRTYKRVVSTSDGLEISEESLSEEMFSRQGSNFNAAAVGAWIFLFVAFAYFYFLTPSLIPKYNYFQVPSLASSPIGFFLFGFLVLLLTGTASAFLPRVFYSYYQVSKNEKMAIMLTIPLLAVSIIISVYLGTICPAQEVNLRTVAFFALFVSQIALLWPVYLDTLEGVR